MENFEAIDAMMSSGTLTQMFSGTLRRRPDAGDGCGRWWMSATAAHTLAALFQLLLIPLPMTGTALMPVLERQGAGARLVPIPHDTLGVSFPEAKVIGIRCDESYPALVLLHEIGHTLETKVRQAHRLGAAAPQLAARLGGGGLALAVSDEIAASLFGGAIASAVDLCCGTGTTADLQDDLEQTLARHLRNSHYRSAARSLLDDCLAAGRGLASLQQGIAQATELIWGKKQMVLT